MQSPIQRRDAISGLAIKHLWQDLAVGFRRRTQGRS